jgi:hypothetical protein
MLNEENVLALGGGTPGCPDSCAARAVKGITSEMPIRPPLRGGQFKGGAVGQLPDPELGKNQLRTCGKWE